MGYRYALAFASLALLAGGMGKAEVSQDSFGRSVAECAVNKDAEIARQYVVTLPQYETSKNQRDYRRLLQKCIPDDAKIKFNGFALAYEIAKVIVERSPDSKSLDFSKMAELERPILPVLVRSAKGKEQLGREFESFVAISNFGECVVRSAPSQAIAFVKNETDADMREKADLQLALDGCLAGETVKLNRELVRGSLAFAYVRLAKEAERGAQ